MCRGFRAKIRFERRQDRRSSVGRYRLADNEAGIVRAKERRQLGDVNRLSRSGGWNGAFRIARFLARVVIGDGLGVVFHRYPARGDRVDANAAMGQLHGDRPREGNDRAFGGGVERVFRRALQSVNRGDVAYRAASIEHLPRDLLRQQELRVEIHVE